jgi:hypothetical protein
MQYAKRFKDISLISSGWCKSRNPCDNADFVLKSIWRSDLGSRPWPEEMHLFVIGSKNTRP